MILPVGQACVRNGVPNSTTVSFKILAHSDSRRAWDRYTTAIRWQSTSSSQKKLGLILVNDKDSSKVVSKVTFKLTREVHFSVDETQIIPLSILDQITNVTTNSSRVFLALLQCYWSIMETAVPQYRKWTVQVVFILEEINRCQDWMCAN